MAHGSPRCGVTCLASPSFASPSAPLAPGYRKAKRTGYRFANLVRTDWSTRRDHFHTTSGFSFCLLLLLLLALQDPARCVLFCAWVRLMIGRKGFGLSGVWGFGKSHMELRIHGGKAALPVRGQWRGLGLPGHRRGWRLDRAGSFPG